MSTKKIRVDLPRAAAALLVLLLVGLAARAAYLYFSLGRGMKILRLETETSRLASSLFFEKMTAIAQLTLGLLGATWALLTVAESRIDFRRFGVVACFVAANCAFLASLAVYSLGYDLIISRVFHHAAFDIDAPFVQFFRSYQLGFCAVGCLAVALVILLGRRTK